MTAVARIASNTALQLTQARASELTAWASGNTPLLHWVATAARAVAADCPNR
jgi:hypothetical protein